MTRRQGDVEDRTLVWYRVEPDAAVVALNDAQ